MRLTSLLTEISVPKILYHGRGRKHSTYFDINTVAGNDALDQNGPGIYLTSDLKDAMRYTKPGGVLLTIEHSLKNVIFEDDRLGKYKTIALKMINDAPKLDETLIDWGYDPPYTNRIQAYNEMRDVLIDPVSAKDTFLNIWGDVYYNHGNGVLYVKNMAKYGIDGLLVPQRDNTVHVIVYNPKKLKIVDEKII